MTTLIQVALGGALGASGRYLAGRMAMQLFGPGFPWGTMIVNVLGSFIMGSLVVILGHFSAHRFGAFLTVGMLGGFTTFSSFSLDAITLWERGQSMVAAAYILGSVILSLSALMLGMGLFRSLLHP